MKLLNKTELFKRPELKDLTEGTNRVLEFPFRIEISGVLNNVFTDVMVSVKDSEVEAIEFDVVEDFYTVDQKDGIENLLTKQYAI